MPRDIRTLGLEVCNQLKRLKGPETKTLLSAFFAEAGVGPDRTFVKVNLKITEDGGVVKRKKQALSMMLKAFLYKCNQGNQKDSGRAGMTITTTKGGKHSGFPPSRE
jgi:hypothetical protein